MFNTLENLLKELYSYKLKNELLNEKYNLHVIGDIYHRTKTVDWDVPLCVNEETKPLEYKLKLDSKLCKHCLSIHSITLALVKDNNQNFRNDLSDLVSSDTDLQSEPLTANVDDIKANTNTITLLNSLGREFEEALESMNEQYQSYMILSEFDSKGAKELIDIVEAKIQRLYNQTLSAAYAKKLVYKAIANIKNFEIKPGYSYVVTNIYGLKDKKTVLTPDQNLLSLWEDLDCSDIAYIALLTTSKDVLNGYKLVKLPNYIISYLEKYAPHGLKSKVYLSIDKSTMDVINTLYNPYSEDIYSNFDTAYQAAINL